MTTLVFGRLNPPSSGDVAEHEIEHACHQQRHAEHKDDRKRTAEGTGQVFEGDVECFHVAVIPLIAQGAPGQVQEHSFQVRLADIHRGDADRELCGRLEQMRQDQVAVLYQHGDQAILRRDA